MEISGVEEGLRLSTLLPRLLYVKRPAPALEPELERMLDEVKAQGAMSYRSFGVDELRELLLDDLALLLTDRFGVVQHEPTPSGVAPAGPGVGHDTDRARA